MHLSPLDSFQALRLHPSEHPSVRSFRLSLAANPGNTHIISVRGVVHHGVSPQYAFAVGILCIGSILGARG